MGFVCQGLWGMGYDRPMGYGLEIPANQVGLWMVLWDMRGYGL